MLRDEDCRTAGFGKTERPVGWEGNGETPCEANEALQWGNLAATDRLLLPMPSHSFTLDFSLFSDDRSFLADARPQIEDYLVNLRLKIHPVKSQLFETQIGASFVGFRVLPTHTRVRTANLQQARAGVPT
jgi:hypothetical protein